jgi:hypothetical protein
MVPYTTFSSSGLWCRNISAPSRWGIAPRLMLRQLQYSLPSLKRSFGLSGEVPEASSNYGTPPRFGRPFAELLLSTCDRVEIPPVSLSRHAVISSRSQRMNPDASRGTRV